MSRVLARFFLPLWTLMLFVLGLSCAAVLPEPHPWWALLFLGLQGLIHALMLALLLYGAAKLLAANAGPIRRAIASAGLSAITTYIAVDARVYGISGQHIDRNTGRHFLAPFAIDVLGLQPLDFVEVSALLVGLSLLAYAALGASARPTRNWAYAIGATACLELSSSAAGALFRYRGVQPLLGLSRAMPLEFEFNDERLLSKVLGGLPQAVDEDYQFPNQASLVGEHRALLPRPLPTRAQRWPDILLISVESLRADALPAMPIVSAWSRRGLAAREHYSGGNCSFLGIFTLLSGLDPIFWTTSQTEVAPLGLAAFHSLGYQIELTTSAALNLGVLPAVAPEGAAAMVPLPRRLSPPERDEFNTRWAENWAKAKRDRPSLAVLFYDSSHWPYMRDGQPAHGLGLGTSWDRRAEAEAFHQRYRLSLAEIDERIGRVLAALESAGKSETTVVVITGDHGEAFREHGVFGHGSRIDEEQVRVPLLMFLPGEPPGEIAVRSMHQDVLPTVLGYLAAEPRSQGFGTGIDVRSHEVRAAPPLIGNCGTATPTGFAALLDDHRLLFQYDQHGATFVGLADATGTLISRTADQDTERALDQIVAGYRSVAR